MYDVITIGSCVRDFFLSSTAFKVISDPDSLTGESECFALGTKINLDNFHVDVGGGAANSAVTFARQGLKAAIISKVGEDPSGAEIVKELKKEKVDVGFAKFDKDERTASSFILLAEAGKRTILTYRGASANFTKNDIPFSKLNTKWLYISSLGGNFEVINKIIDFAEKKDYKIAINPGKSELSAGVGKLAKALSCADVFFLNREEASILTGVDYDSKESITHALCLLAKGIGVVTDGVKGATVCDGRNFYHIGVQKVKAVDATGAGDAFASGFVAGLIRYGNLIEPAMQLAVNNSASVVMHLGAKKGILKKQQPSPFMQNMKVKVVQIK